MGGQASGGVQADRSQAAGRSVQQYCDPPFVHRCLKWRPREESGAQKAGQNSDPGCCREDGWRDPSILIPPKSFEDQTRLLDWIKDQVNYPVRLRRVNDPLKPLNFFGIPFGSHSLRKAKSGKRVRSKRVFPRAWLWLDLASLHFYWTGNRNAA